MIVVNAFIKKNINRNGCTASTGVARGGKRVHGPPNF